MVMIFLFKTVLQPTSTRLCIQKQGGGAMINKCRIYMSMCFFILKLKFRQLEGFGPGMFPTLCILPPGWFVAVEKGAQLDMLVWMLKGGICFIRYWLKY